MRAGLLDTPIDIKRAVVSKNKYGEKVQTYEPVYNTKARVIYNSGNRAVENGEILHNYSITFEVWDYVTVLDTDYVYYEEADYRILSIEHDKHQQKKILRCDKVNE